MVYKFHRRIDGRVPPAEVTRPYEKLPIPTDLAIVHITLLVAGSLAWEAERKSSLLTAYWSESTESSR